MENLCSQFRFLANCRMHGQDVKVFKINDQEVIQTQCSQNYVTCPVIRYAYEYGWERSNERRRNYDSHNKVSYIDIFNFNVNDAQTAKQAICTLCKSCKNNVK